MKLELTTEWVNDDNDGEYLLLSRLVDIAFAFHLRGGRVVGRPDSQVAGTSGLLDA